MKLKSFKPYKGECSNSLIDEAYRVNGWVSNPIRENVQIYVRYHLFNALFVSNPIRENVQMKQSVRI